MGALKTNSLFISKQHIHDSEREFNFGGLDLGKFCKILTLTISVLFFNIPAFHPAAQAQTALRVAYLIPGSNKEPFWQSAAAFAQAAADDLGFILEVHYAFNDGRKLLAIGTDVANRHKDKPNYVIFHDYEGAAPYILNEIERNNIYGFTVGTGLSDSVRQKVKGPRENFKNWIGEIKVDNVGGGYTLAKLLFRSAFERGLTSASGRYTIALVNGSAGDTAAQDRQAGAELAAKEYYRGEIISRSVADWSRITARAIAARAFEKNPTTPLYWSANDLMALGLLDTFERTRRIPGQDTLIGCFNWSPYALQAIANNQIEFSLGGHFTEVGLAMVMLFDYSRGKDFKDKGLSQTTSYALVTKENVKAVYQRMVRNDFSSIDFRKFSRVLNPNWQDYNIDALAFLKEVR